MYCTACQCDISKAHSGHDIKKHAGTKKHTGASTSIGAQPPISGFMQCDQSLDMRRAELLFMSYLTDIKTGKGLQMYVWQVVFQSSTIFFLVLQPIFLLCHK